MGRINVAGGSGSALRWSRSGFRWPVGGGAVRGGGAETADRCPSILPCDAARAGPAATGEIALRRRRPLPVLSRSRTCVCRGLPARPRLRRAADPRRGARRRHRPPGRADEADRVRPDPVGPARGLRPEPRRPDLPPRGDRRRLPGDRLPQRPGDKWRRAPRPAEDRLQPDLRRRPARGDPRHVRRPRRRRQVRPAGGGSPQRPVHLPLERHRGDGRVRRHGVAGRVGLGRADRRAGRLRRADPGAAVGPGLGRSRTCRSRRGTARSA